MSKLHPHIRAFIRSVIFNETDSIAPSKNMLWKEELFQQLQEFLVKNIEVIHTKEDMDQLIDEKTKLLEQEIIVVLKMINNTMKNIPLDIIKKIK